MSPGVTAAASALLVLLAGWAVREVLFQWIKRRRRG